MNNQKLGMEFAVIFRCYLDIFSECGSIELLRPLLSSFRAGKKHRYYNWIVECLQKFVDSIDFSDEASHLEKHYLTNISSVCNYCFGILFEDDERIEVKELIFDLICSKLLSSIPSNYLGQLVCLPLETSTSAISFCLSNKNTQTLQQNSFVSKFITNIQKSNIDGSVRDSGDVDAFYKVIECSYHMLGIIYDRCSISSIKNEITQTFAG